jgi:hypothetical protein
MDRGYKQVQWNGYRPQQPERLLRLPPASSREVQT